jgi:subtilisin family serine protease
MKTIQSIIIIFSFFFLVPNVASSQGYWVYFKDKNNVEFNPETYFDSKTIERRKTTLGKDWYDSTDYPINQIYKSEVSKIVDSIFFESNWLNAVYVETNTVEVDKIKELPFVKKVEISDIQMQRASSCVQAKKSVSEREYDIYLQKAIHDNKEFKNRNISGKGVRIAVLDAGFPGVDKHKGFEKLRNENRIVKTYNFVKNKENVYEKHWHGTAVLGCIAGYNNENALGLAPQAEFLLALTEYSMKEGAKDEAAWIAGIEWAEKNGADIVTSSLGYMNPIHYGNEMDGSSAIAQVANMAVKKGLLVLNAVGNEGEGDWKYLITPSDADLVLAVGGLDRKNGIKINFSSYGPSVSNKVKPEIMSFGNVFTTSETGYGKYDGTSFSTPMLAGFAACTKQAFPNLTGEDLRNKIIESGSLYPYYDFAHGYGAPSAKKLFNADSSNNEIEFTLYTDGEFEYFLTSNVTIDTMKKSIEADTNQLFINRKYYSDKVFCKFEDEENNISTYYVFTPESTHYLRFDISEVLSQSQYNKLKVFFNNKLYTFDINNDTKTINNETEY